MIRRFRQTAKAERTAAEPWLGFSATRRALFSLSCAIRPSPVYTENTNFVFSCIQRKYSFRFFLYTEKVLKSYPAAIIPQFKERLGERNTDAAKLTKDVGWFVKSLHNITSVTTN